MAVLLLLQLLTFATYVTCNICDISGTFDIYDASDSYDICHTSFTCYTSYGYGHMWQIANNGQFQLVDQNCGIIYRITLKQKLVQDRPQWGFDVP